MLNKDWTLDKKKGQKSIFDDFLGSGSESAEEDQPKETITVDEAQVLAFAVEKAMQQKQTLLGLLLIEEQALLKAKMNDGQKLRLAKTLLLDFIIGYIAQNSKRSQSGIVNRVLQNLATSLGIKTDAVYEFLLRTCQQLGQVRLEIELLIDIDSQGQDPSLKDLTRIFEESQRLQGFLTICNRFGGFLLDSQEIDIGNNERMLCLIQQLVRLIDCHMLQSSKNTVPQRQETKEVIFDDEESNADMEFEEKEPKEIKQIKNAMRADVGQQWPESRDPNYLAKITRGQREVQLRFVSMLMILLSAFHVSLNCNKHTLAKELLIQAQILLGVCQHFGQQLADGTIQSEQLEQINSLFKYQAVKTLLNKLEITLLRNQEWGIAALKLVKDHALLGETGGELHRRKHNRDIEKDRDPYELQFIRVWLRTCCVMQLSKNFQEKRLQDQAFYNFQLQKTELLIQETAAKTPPKSLPLSFEFVSPTISINDVLKAIFANETSFSLRQIVDLSYEQTSSLESVCSHLFDKALSLKAQHGLTNDIETFFRNRFVNHAGKVFLGSYFFPNEIKFRDFCTTMELTTYMNSLQEHHLSLLKTQPGGDAITDNHKDAFLDLPIKIDRQKNADNSATFRKPSSLSMPEQVMNSSSDYINQKLQGGVEVFKQLRETVSDFCFDNCNPDNMAFALQARGMREISISKTLLYRNRTSNGFEFIDEELYSWSDMLHRYDQIAIVHQKLKPKSDSVKAAIMGLYQKPTSFGTHRPVKRTKYLFLDEVLNPAEIYCNDLSAKYLNAYSNLDITHEDYSNAIESHPKLPLYVTGNSKGLLCLWSFGQVTDRSLNQWILDPETPPAQANPKKSTIHKIAFSDGGDKIAAANMDGSLYIMSFDLKEQSKQISLYDTTSLTRSREFRINDFQFLDGDSLIACCSVKEKSVHVLDTMMPPKHSIVLQLKSGGGGNLLTVNSNKQRLYCFNSKPGIMCEYDLRMLKDAVNQLSLGKEEITAVCSDPITDALIVGFNDGIIKIYDEEKTVIQLGQRKTESLQSAYQARETINAFTNIEGKKKPVSQIKVHPDNGSLFASSAAGVIKLLRLQA